MATYLQLDGKEARIYEYSKEPKEGFEKHEGKSVTYRKYYNKGLFGYLQNVSVRESKIGEQLQVTVKQGDEYINLQFPLYTQSGNIENRYAESLIRFLPVLEKGKGYRFYPYAIDQKDSEYKTYGISVIESPNPEAEEKGAKVEPYLTYAKNPKTETEIPNLEWKKIAGKNKPTAASTEAKDEFLYSYLTQATDGHLKYDGNSSTDSAPKTENSNSTSKETPTPQVEEVDEYDDLPF